MSHVFTPAVPRPTFTFDEFLHRAGTKERAKIEKYLETCPPSHASLWRRLALMLGSLTPLAIHSTSKTTWQFLIPDGKYRKQVFALEDGRDGTLIIYLPDVLEEALSKNLLVSSEHPRDFGLPGKPGYLRVESLDAGNTPQAQPHYKHMLGWNRKALRLTLATDDPGPQADAAWEMLCLAAQAWPERAE